MVKNIFSILFLLLWIDISAQTKNSAEIVNFTVDTIIHYKIKYTGNSLEFQVEEFNGAKWNSISSVGSETLDGNSSKETIVEDKLSKLISGRKYRLKITYPMVLISEEITCKK